MTTEARERFFRLWGEIEDLASANAVLGWDQVTCMPPAGVGGRSKVLATLAGIRHDKLVDAELQDAFAACSEEVDDSEEGALLGAQLREARRRIDRAQRVPAELTRALAEAVSRGQHSWQRAREASDFALFRQDLEHLVRLKREEAQALAPGGDPYEALMDEFEPGSKVVKLEKLFASLVDELSPLVRAVAASEREVDETPARGSFPAARQEAFGRFVAGRIGYDFDRGRLDLAAHPFCTGFHPDDVRLTWRYQEDDFRPALFGIMHEAGHGIYEQGLPPDFARQPLGHAVSLGVHESQSRLWENLVGRSRAFWEWAMPQFRTYFPDADHAGRDPDRLWPALHTVRPSLIRVEADEATYNLHIVIRFDLERAVIGGTLEVAELPEAWDAAYQRLLGVRAEKASDGVLQDIHWSMGAFGYFHTYALGNLINAQLFDAARAALGDLDAAFARGEFLPLRDWLREQVHRHGSRWPAEELVERASGRPLDSESFLRHVRAATEAVYGV